MSESVAFRIGRLACYEARAAKWSNPARAKTLLSSEPWKEWKPKSLICPGRRGIRHLTTPDGIPPIGPLTSGPRVSLRSGVPTIRSEERLQTHFPACCHEAHPPAPSEDLAPPVRESHVSHAGLLCVASAPVEDQPPADGGRNIPVCSIRGFPFEHLQQVRRSLGRAAPAVQDQVKLNRRNPVCTRGLQDWPTPSLMFPCELFSDNIIMICTLPPCADAFLNPHMSAGFSESSPRATALAILSSS